MKPSLKIFIASILFSTLSQAFEITDLQIAGSGCEVPVGGHELIPILVLARKHRHSSKCLWLEKSVHR